jgi:hypothetical protein
MYIRDALPHAWLCRLHYTKLIGTNRQKRHPAISWATISTGFTMISKLSPCGAKRSRLQILRATKRTLSAKRRRTLAGTDKDLSFALQYHPTVFRQKL